MAKKSTESKKPAKTPEPSSVAKSPETDKALTTRTDSLPATRRNTGLAGRGFENLEKSDLLLPRIKLLQPLSPEIGDLNQEAGTIFLGLSNKNFGKKITIIPVLHFRSRIKWTPEDDGGGIDCSSPDGRAPRETKYAKNCASCSHQLWNDNAKAKKDKAPKCTLYDNFLVLIDDSKEPVIIPMERSKAKVAKRFYSMGALKGGDMWDHQYELSVVGEKNEDGKPFFNYSVRDLSKSTSDERKKLCLTLWESLAGKTISEANQEKDGQASNAGASAEKAGAY